MKATGRFLQTSERPARPGLRDNLYEPRRDGLENSALPALVPGFGTRQSSLFLKMQEHPAATFAIGTLATMAIIAALTPRRLRRSRGERLQRRMGW